MTLHYPKVRIVTPEPTSEHPVAPTILTKIEVDDALWPIIDYRIDGEGVDGLQSITLRFHADVTVVHEKARR